MLVTPKSRGPGEMHFTWLTEDSLEAKGLAIFPKSQTGPIGQGNSKYDTTFNINAGTCLASKGLPVQPQ